ncbi:phosphodiester glycosidase family protein [Nodosilinea sp. P-1105]|uniref:phosphodiester glycosidase family protein n=1 Tax=Nodosilinea sp. P-1105 TaxID=2546229 RepID=UPI00146AC607|nr:phosphodiester glycosidase family protein [Nodosilinea sp. P-1105]
MIMPLAAPLTRVVLPFSLALVAVGGVGSGGSRSALAQEASSTQTLTTPPATEIRDAPTAMLAAAQVGTTVAINGSTFSMPWMQVNGQVGLVDYGVTDRLGATLLSTSNPQVQPVQWFAVPGASPIMLSAWHHNGYRFLDISPLAQGAGWTVTPQGSTLAITTTPAQVQSIRRDLQPGRDRIILDVTGRPAVQLNEGVEELTLTLSATSASSLTAQANTLTQNRSGGIVTQVQANPASQRTELAVRFTGNTLRPRVQTLPNQVILEFRPDHLQPHTIAWAPGLRWRQQYISVGGTAFPVYWLEIAANQDQLSLRPIWADPSTMVGIAPLQTMGQRWQAIAAINAGFFNRNNQYPLGAIRHNTNWLSSPILSRGVIGWNDSRSVALERLHLRQTLTTANGRSFPIQGTNSGYVEAGIGLYTPAWGTTYRPITGNEIVVTVVNDQVVNQQTVTDRDAVSIPSNGYILAHRSYATAAVALTPGTDLAIQSETLPASLEPFRHIVGGGPLLIRNQTMVLNAEAEQFSRAFATQAAPRSAIATNAAGDILLVAVHHSPAGPGPTLNQLAQIMAQLGSTNALNLDGGGSASLYLGGRLINRNSRTAGRVHNGIGLFTAE